MRNDYMFESAHLFRCRWLQSEYGFRQTLSIKFDDIGEIKRGYTHFAEGDVGLAKITPCFENREID